MQQCVQKPLLFPAYYFLFPEANVCVGMLVIFKTKLVISADGIFIESSLREERFKCIRNRGGTGNVHSSFCSQFESHANTEYMDQNRKATRDCLALEQLATPCSFGKFFFVCVCF